MDHRIRIRLHPSRQYLALLLALLSLTGLVILNLPLSFGWRVFLFMAAMVCFGWVWWRDIAPLSRQAIIALDCGTDRQVTLEMRNGGTMAGLVTPDTLVTPWLISLNIALADQGRRSLLLFKDSMATGDHRRLRSTLRNSRTVQP